MMACRLLLCFLVVELTFAVADFSLHEGSCENYLMVSENCKKILSLKEECELLVNMLLENYGSQREFYHLLVKILHKLERTKRILNHVTDRVKHIKTKAEWAEQTMSGSDLLAADTKQQELEDKQIRDKYLIPMYFQLNYIKEHALHQQTKASNTGEVIAFTIGLKILSSGVSIVAKDYKKLFHLIKSNYSELVPLVKQNRTTVMPKFIDCVDSARIKLHKIIGHLKNPEGPLKDYLNAVKATKSFQNTLNTTLTYLKYMSRESIDKKIEDVTNQIQLHKNELETTVKRSQNFAVNIRIMSEETIGNYTMLMACIMRELDQNLGEHGQFFRSMNPDISSSPVDKLDHTTQIDRYNILQHQQYLISILSNISYSMRTILSNVHTLKTLIGSVKKGLIRNAPVWQMHEDVITTLRQHNTHGLDQGTVSFPSLVGCLASMTPGSSSYGTYPLDFIRDVCLDGIPKKFPKEYVNHHHELAINVTVLKSVKEHMTFCSMSKDACFLQVQADLNDFFTHDPLLSKEMLLDQEAIVTKINFSLLEGKSGKQISIESTGSPFLRKTNSANIYALSDLQLFALLSIVLFTFCYL